MKKKIPAKTKLDRESVVQAALRLLNEEGAEGLTLRRLASDLHVQAPALYWHFVSKQELLDAMATQVFCEAFESLGLPKAQTPWQDWCRQLASAERQMLLGYRDGARFFSGTYLTDASMYAPMEASLQKLTGDGFPLPIALQALATVHCYVVGFTIEEQAVWPKPGERDSRYAPEQRSARIDSNQFPLTQQAGDAVFASPDQRFAFGLEAIIRGLQQLREEMP
jgi:AcrR family transcriptional regulator